MIEKKSAENREIGWSGSFKGMICRLIKPNSKALKDVSWASP